MGFVYAIWESFPCFGKRGGVLLQTAIEWGLE